MYKLPLNRQFYLGAVSGCPYSGYFYSSSVSGCWVSGLGVRGALQALFVFSCALVFSGWEKTKCAYNLRWLAYSEGSKDMFRVITVPVLMITFLISLTL